MRKVIDQESKELKQRAWQYAAASALVGCAGLGVAMHWLGFWGGGAVALALWSASLDARSRSLVVEHNAAFRGARSAMLAYHQVIHDIDAEREDAE